MADRSCTDCGGPISVYSLGRCRACAGRASLNDPAKKEARLEKLRASLRTPQAIENKRRARLRVEADRANDPAWQEAKRLSGLRLRADYDSNPDAQAKSLAARAQAGRKTSERRMGWCPPERRAEYQKLRAKVGAGDARAAIEAEIPGTMAHAQRMIASADLAMRLRREHQTRQAY